MTKLAVTVLTPYLTLISKDVDMVVIPAEDGEIGILPEHIALIAQLKPGIIKTYNDNKVEDRLFIFGGFARVEQNKLHVLVSAYSKIEDLDPVKAEAEIPVFEERLMTTTNWDQREVMFKEIMIRRKIIESRLSA